jgi:hypothetical protein
MHLFYSLTVLPTSMDKQHLATVFSERLRDTVRQAHALDYHPHRFEQMLNVEGGLALAHRLVKSGELQDGLRALIRLGRRDLAMESIMLEEEFKPLFTPAERAAARWRLEQALQPYNDPSARTKHGIARKRNENI